MRTGTFCFGWAGLRPACFAGSLKVWLEGPVLPHEARQGLARAELLELAGAMARATPRAVLLALVHLHLVKGLRLSLDGHPAENLVTVLLVAVAVRIEL